jgi:NAD(P)-dependent dehydrogenase (short-subunit alcohol dehydrogenase family)
MSYLERLMNIEGKVVLVTGVAGQLGRAISEAFIDAGAIVIGTDRVTPDRMPCDYNEFYLMDVTLKNQVHSVFEDVFKKYGKLDVLVNNAGVSTFEPFEDRPEEKFEWVMNVNLKGTFFCIQAYVNLYDQYSSRRGCIVNIGSHFGVVSPDFRNYTDCERKNSEIYGATKAGVIQMTKYFAVHLADRNIRVNAVSPGGIFNPQIPQGGDFIRNYSFRCPMKRMGEQSEIIGAIFYFSSDAASYTTGQNLIVDGGITCW